MNVSPKGNYSRIASSLCVILLSVLFPLKSFAAEDTGPTKALMHALVFEYVKMSPYLASDEAFTSEKGKEVIGDSLTALEKRIQSTPPLALKKNPGFRVSYSLLADHISKTKEVFDSGEYIYARMRVNGIGNLCAGCHIQAPKISHFSAFESINARSRDGSYENANFLYTLRRYDEALKMIDGLVRKFPTAKVNADQIYDLYRYKLSILARVSRDPKAARESLALDLKNTKLPSELRANIKVWMTNLAAWEKEDKPPSELSTPELISYVASRVPADLSRRVSPSDPQLLNLLRQSGLLYERLFTHPESDQAQKLLYYLARCERSLAPYYWYSVSEVYLKECIVQYPKQEYSKRCYDAYEAGMRERYPHSMPESVRQSLLALKDYL